MMNGEAGDTPVRRSSRARKPNSRFADDELDGCFKKIVTGVVPPESSGSAGSTPTRQKKSGKKRETDQEAMDENAPVSKETLATEGGISRQQSKPNESVNGLLQEDDAPVDAVKSTPEKPQERRTRSNSRREDVEGQPQEEKKRGGRKGSKGRSKGNESNNSSKSEPDKDKSVGDNSSLTNKQSSSNPSVMLDSEAEAKGNQDVPSFKEGCPSTEGEGTEENILKTAVSHIKEKKHKDVNVEEADLSHEKGQALEDDLKVSKPSDAHLSTSYPSDLKSPVESIALNEEGQSISKEMASKLEQQTETCLRKIENPESESKSQDSFKDPEFVDKVFMKQNENIESDSGSSSNTASRDLLKNVSKGPQQLKHQSCDEEDQFNVEESSLSDSNKSRIVDDPSVQRSSGKIIFSAEDLLEPYSSSPVSGSRVIAKENVNFSEAETSTPVGHKGLSTSKQESVHAQDRYCDDSSDIGTSLTGPGRNPKDLVDVHSSSQVKSSDYDDEDKAVLEEHLNIIPSSTSSPTKRKGHSSKQTSRDIQKNKDAMLEITPLNVAESKTTELSCDQLTSSGEADDKSKLIEKADSDKIKLPQVSETENTKSPVKDQPLKEDNYVHKDQVADKEVRGKRSRNESASESEEGRGGHASTQESPQNKKKKAADTSEVEQRGDQKRKLQPDSSEDGSIRKKKKGEGHSGGTSVADLVKRLSQEKDGSEMQDDDTLSNIQDCGGVKESNAEEKSDKVSEFKAVKAKLNENRAESGNSCKNIVKQHEEVEENPDVEEKRHSSLGSILSLLKRPDVVKNIEESSAKRSRDDRRSSESRKGDKKWKDGDKGQEKKWKGSDESLPRRSYADSSDKHDDGDMPRRKKDDQYSGEMTTKKLDKSSSEDQAKGSTNVDENMGWETMKNLDMGSMSWDCMKDSKLMETMTWGSMKDATSLTFESNKKTESKKVLEAKPSSKTSDTDITKVKNNDDDDDVADRRNSSIGNILSFLKRGGQNTQPAKQDKPKVSSGENLPTKSVCEEKIFSFVETSRKSTPKKSEDYSSCGKRVEGDTVQKPKSGSKGRERRVSRWSAKEDTVQPSVNQWESSAPISQNIDVLSSTTRGNSSGSKWSEQRKPGIHSVQQWGEGLQGMSSSKEETKDIHVPSEMSWNDSRSSWGTWTSNQSQGQFTSPYKVPETRQLNTESRGADKKTQDIVSDDENVDYGNRAGLSEFIENYEEELNQSTDEAANRSQPSVYQSEISSSSQSQDMDWTKREMSLSPEREIFRISSREKELDSPPREQAWSPKSNEIVLSPKSRELMSSLRNMEVKLTPHVQELVSSVSPQSKPESVPHELNLFPLNHDIVSIPLPSEPQHSESEKQDISSSLGMLEFASKSFETSQEENRGSLESSWRSRADRFEKSRIGKYDLKAEVKEEDHHDKGFASKSGIGEEIHDDKENLEPKVEEKEFEEEKLEYQRRIQRDLEVKGERNKIIVEQRMKSFVHLKENFYLSDRKKSKRSKEVRRMVCDCSLSKEEIARDEVGCGEDCLNRLLMIECGSRCPLKDRCTNKRFQNFEYADVEVFNAEEKGCGIRACKMIPAGTFIMEYVGEVFDSREFKRRRKEYSKNLNAHFYFMALKGDLFIDATRKGNISRFINHSCDPNAQTQKWTVNGELRVGFFAQKMIEAGEEINFDYRLERYGREPQRCYCGTAICRGWLGESPDEKTKEEKEEERRQERDRRRREEKRSYTEDVDLEDEIEKLNAIKLRTRQDVLNLCRLMVRADNSNSRVMLLRLVQSSTSACKRLFMDYHGLSLLWSWMADLGYAYEHAAIKIEILKTLECLPITNKTQLTDSRVLGVVERWSTQSVEIPISGSPPPPPPPKPGHVGSEPGIESGNVDSDSGKKSSDTSEDSDGEMDAKPIPAALDSSSVDDASMDSADVEQDALKSKPSLEGCLAEDDSSDSNLSDEKKCAVEPGEGDTAASATPEDKTASRELLLLHKSMVELANKLLELWKDLKEYFRIPKKERIELMKEHEREVEEEIRGLDKDRKEKDKYKRDFDRRRRSPDRDKDRHGRRRSDRDSREDRSSDSPKMSKEQRRQLFEIQVQQEEEEAKQRKMQEEMWAMHVERCRLLGQDPYLTPIFDPTCQYYWDPNSASWQPYNGSDPNLPVPAAYGYRPNESGDGSPIVMGVPSGHVIAAQPLAGHLAPDSEAHTPNPDDPRIDPATIPLPGEVRQTSPTQPLPCQAVPVEGTPPQGARVLTFPMPAEAGVAVTPTTTVPVNLAPSALAVPFVVGEEPPPPPPGPITIQLPPRWKMARDSEGHVYFYHVKTRTSQWEPPTLEQHQQLEATVGSDSDSNDDDSSDSDSTSTTDSEDFSSDEEEEEEEEKVTTVEISEFSDEKMIRRHRTKKPRSEALVQERVISPVLEMDKEAARRERREAKERAQKEVRQERQDDRLHDSGVDVLETEETESISDKIQRMERPESVVEKERNEYREKAKIREKTKSKERAATAIADNSDTARKCKENFRAKMATYIVSVLNPYRRDDCKIGRITCNEDFKYLARKLTHFVMIKELKQLHSVEDLECNDSVKYKTKDFVRKYMSKYGHEFKRDPSDTKEY